MSWRWHHCCRWWRFHSRQRVSHRQWCFRVFDLEDWNGDPSCHRLDSRLKTCSDCLGELRIEIFRMLTCGNVVRSVWNSGNMDVQTVLELTLTSWQAWYVDSHLNGFEKSLWDTPEFWLKPCFQNQKVEIAETYRLNEPDGANNWRSVQVSFKHGNGFDWHVWHVVVLIIFTEWWITTSRVQSNYSKLYSPCQSMACMPEQGQSPIEPAPEQKTCLNASCFPHGFLTCVCQKISEIMHENCYQNILYDWACKRNDAMFGSHQQR